MNGFRPALRSRALYLATRPAPGARGVSGISTSAVSLRNNSATSKAQIARPTGTRRTPPQNAVSFSTSTTRLFEEKTLDVPTSLRPIPENVERAPLQTWNSSSETWEPVTAASPLESGTEIDVVSWDVGHDYDDPAARVGALLKYLESKFGTEPQRPMVLMLQVVLDDALYALLENQWIKQNFAITDLTVPESVLPDGPTPIFKQFKRLRKGFFRKDLDAFALTLVSRQLPTSGSFRAPLCGHGRDILVVDIPTASGETLRLCNARLDVGAKASDARDLELGRVSALLKGSESPLGTQISAGIAGLDVAYSERGDTPFHVRPQVQLQDAFFEGNEEFASKAADKENVALQVGTWGVSLPRKFSRRARILYTGGVKSIAAPSAADDATGNVGRLGIGLTTETSRAVLIAQDGGKRIAPLKVGQIIKKGEANVTDELVGPLMEFCQDGSISYETRTSPVSDHLGIVTTVKID